MVDYNTENIYYFFRKAQAEFKNRGFRIPKNFDAHLQNKMSKKNRDALIMARDYFNTKWQNIDPLRYFHCGFELYKSFTYVMFFHQNVMSLYKEKDKIIKRGMKADKGKLKSSMEFVKAYNINHGIASIKDYCNVYDGEISLVTKHYLSNEVDGIFVIFLIRKRLFRPNDAERLLMPYITINYNEMVEKLKEMGFRI